MKGGNITMDANEVRQGRRHLILSVAAVLLGGALLLGFQPTVEESYWVDYIRGLRGTGWMLLLFGVIWTALSWLRYRTSFFDLGRPLQGDLFALLVLGVTIGAIILIVIILPHLPPLLPDPLPEDAKVRTALLRQYANIRLLTTGVILFSAGALLAFPSRRFFAH